VTKKDKVSTRWLTEQFVATKASNGREEFRLKDVVEPTDRDEGGVRSALRDLAARGDLVDLGRGRWGFPGKPKSVKGKSGKPGAMAARIDRIVALLEEHGPLSRATLAQLLGDEAGDVAPKGSGSTSLWKAAKQGRIVRKGNDWAAA
jgi:hypothetical protein